MPRSDSSESLSVDDATDPILLPNPSRALSRLIEGITPKRPEAAMQTYTAFFGWLTVASALVCALGCDHHMPADAGNSSDSGDKAQSAANSPDERAPAGKIDSEWTTSSDGKLRLRVGIAARVPDKGLNQFGAELHNNSKEPITVLKPFADSYHDETLGIHLQGPKGRCKFIGPTPGTDLGAGAFVTLQPGESTGGYLDLDPRNFEHSDEPGLYRLAYRYSANEGHQRAAADQKLPPIWIGEIESQTVIFARGDVPRPRGPEGAEPEENVELVFPRGGYRFTLAEAAAGVKLRYEIVVKKDLPGIICQLQDIGGAGGEGRASTSGVAPFTEIYGNGQSYALRDSGLSPHRIQDPATIKVGRSVEVVDWQGRNWDGPSDTMRPQGPPFPAGKYSLTVTLQGTVMTPQGRRLFRIAKSAPVELVP